MAADLRFIEGEYGFGHEFIFPSGTDLTWITAINLKIKDGSTSKLNITSDLVASGTKITWSIQNGQTNYTGDLKGTLILTGSGPRQEEIHFPVNVISKTT